jgi:hypothetical protein
MVVLIILLARLHESAGRAIWHTPGVFVHVLVSVVQKLNILINVLYFLITTTSRATLSFWQHLLYLHFSKRKRVYCDRLRPSVLPSVHLSVMTSTAKPVTLNTSYFTGLFFRMTACVCTKKYFCDPRGLCRGDNYVKMSAFFLRNDDHG